MRKFVNLDYRYIILPLFLDAIAKVFFFLQEVLVVCDTVSYKFLRGRFASETLGEKVRGQSSHPAVALFFSSSPSALWKSFTLFSFTAPGGSRL